MTMITQEGFEAYLKCPRKSHLISEGSAGVQSRFYEWQRGLEKDYKETASVHIRNSMRRDDWCMGTPGIKPLSERGYCLIFDYMVAEPDVHARLHALELHGEGARMGPHYHCPIRFVSREKLTRLDKLLLAFDAFAFSRATGKLPAIAKIVHGHRYLTIFVVYHNLGHLLSLTRYPQRPKQIKQVFYVGTNRAANAPLSGTLIMVERSGSSGPLFSI